MRLGGAFAGALRGPDRRRGPEAAPGQARQPEQSVQPAQHQRTEARPPGVGQPDHPDPHDQLSGARPDGHRQQHLVGERQRDQLDGQQGDRPARAAGAHAGPHQEPDGQQAQVAVQAHRQTAPHVPGVLGDARLPEAPRGVRGGAGVRREGRPGGRVPVRRVLGGRPGRRTPAGPLGAAPGPGRPRLIRRPPPPTPPWLRHGGHHDGSPAGVSLFPTGNPGTSAWISPFPRGRPASPPGEAARAAADLPPAARRVPEGRPTRRPGTFPGPPRHVIFVTAPRAAGRRPRAARAARNSGAGPARGSARGSGR